MTDPMIQVEHLSRVFVRRQRSGASVEAVHDLTFAVPRGQFTGLLGPNGAGKSTTVKMLTGILMPTSGRVTVGGMDPTRERVRLSRRMGVVFGQRTQLWWDLPLKDSFRILEAMYRIPAARGQAHLADLTHLLDLAPLMDVPVRHLSLGQRMRSELAAALLHEPEVLFLDEPTIGLDVAAKRVVRDRLLYVNRTFGTTIMLTTHDMGDVEALCERLVVLSQGRLVFDGPPSGLAEVMGAPRILYVTFARDLDRDRLPSIPATRLTLDDARTVAASFDGRSVSAVSVLEALRTLGEPEDFRLEDAGLEEAMHRFYISDGRSASDA